MKLKDLKQFIDVNSEEVEVNAINMIEDHFFNNPECSDYRNSAINFCNNKKIDWSSTENNCYDVLKRYVKIECPKCHREMEVVNGSGNCNSSYVTYKCNSCETQVNLTIPKKGFSVYFKK